MPSSTSFGSRSSRSTMRSYSSRERESWSSVRWSGGIAFRLAISRGSREQPARSAELEPREPSRREVAQLARDQAVRHLEVQRARPGFRLGRRTGTGSFDASVSRPWDASLVPRAVVHREEQRPVERRQPAALLGEHAERDEMIVRVAATTPGGRAGSRYSSSVSRKPPARGLGLCAARAPTATSAPRATPSRRCCP